MHGRLVTIFGLIAIVPVVIQQESALDDGLVREWPAPDLGIVIGYYNQSLPTSDPPAPPMAATSGTEWQLLVRPV